MKSSPTQPLAWHHFKFMLPGDWEVTSHSEEDRNGRLEFSTRKGLQGLVAWEPCKRVPDREVTMLTFLQSQVPGLNPKDIQSPRDLEIRTIGEFTVGYHSDQTPCQALAYLREPQKLLRWIFQPAPRETLEKVWIPILRSFKPNRGDWREISIFGHGFQMPVDYKLEIMKVSAANVAIGYEHKRKARVAIRRLGLPVYTMEGQSVEEFYPNFLNTQKCIVTESGPARVNGMAAARATYKQRGEHQLDKFMGRFWEGGQAVMWHNTEEKRLYAIEQIGPPKAELLAFEKVFPGLRIDG